MNVKLLGYLKKYWVFALLSPLMMVAEVFIDLLQPKLMATIVDGGVLGGKMDVITSTGLKMLILVALGGAAGLAAAYFASEASQGFSCDLRNDAFGRVMGLSLEQTDKFTAGSLVTRLTNDITQVQNLVAMSLRMFVRAPMSFIGGIVMALSLSVHFSTVLLCALPVQLIAIVYVIKKTTPLFETVQKKLDRVNSVVQENVGGARVVKAYVREDYETKRFDTANAEMRDISYKVQRVMTLLSPVIMILMNVSVVAIIYIGGLQVQAGEMKVGSIMAAVTYVTQILMSMMMVSVMFQTISRANASAKRVTELLGSEAVLKDGPFDANNVNASEKGCVRYKNVSFRYPDTAGRPVINGVSLDIGSGEFVAILGATGAGKTSFISLIPRFYDVTGGSVELDEVDVRDYRLEDLRSRIAFVLQKSELFSGTIMENIRWGRPEASDGEVYEAARTAQADEFITAFKDGYNTMVEEGGVSLSGGQKQRISIARAILRRPEIIIFDDSTSALDLGTEARLRSALREKLRGVTVIMVAQRIASVISADRIAVIEDGKVTAFGPHSTLMQKSAAYRDIYYSQIREEA